MKKLSLIFICALLIFSLTACTGMSDTGSGSTNSGSLSSSLQDAESKISSLLTPSSTDASDSSVVAITRDEAVDIALREADVTKDAIRNLEAELDRDNGVTVWEIDFDSGNMEYSYDINAVTGDITERDRDREDR